MWNVTRFALLAVLAVISFWPDLAAAAPEIGWWWNPNESGRGFFVESHDGIFFLGAYFYDDDGHAKWLVSGGANADPYNYSGRLLAVANGQTLFGTYVPPAPATDAGAVTVKFKDDTHGTITWPGGSIPIVRQIFGAGNVDFQPFNGWWWNEAESGSGYSVELQGNSLFIVGFMYETDGRPVWYFSAGPMSSPTTFSSTLLQFSNGQTMTGPYKPPSAPVTIGTLDVEFLGLDEAVFTFDDGVAAPAGHKYVQRGRGPRTINVKPQFTKCIAPRPAKSYADRYDGTYTQKVTFHDTSNPFVDTTETTTIVANLVFELPELAPPLAPLYQDQCHHPIGFQRYLPTQGQITVTYDYASVTRLGETISCTQTAHNVVLAYPIDLSTTNYLDVRDDYRYVLDLTVPDTRLFITVTGSCTYPDGRTLGLDPEPKEIYINLGTAMGADTYGFHGSRGPITTAESISTYKWDFGAVRPPNR